MPLLDHFHPPLSIERPWEGIHSTWASTIATQLNQDQLPAEYFAMPLVTLGGGVQVNVGTSQTSEQLRKYSWRNRHSDLGATATTALVRS